MSTRATIAGRMPAAESDGLSVVAARQEDEPVTVVGRLVPRKVETDLDTGDRTVKYQIEQIEAGVNEGQENQLHSFLASRRDTRSGVTPLFDHDGPVHIDYETGEIGDDE